MLFTHVVEVIWLAPSVNSLYPPLAARETSEKPNRWWTLLTICVWSSQVVLVESSVLEMLRGGSDAVGRGKITFYRLILFLICMVRYQQLEGLCVFTESYGEV